MPNRKAEKKYFANLDNRKRKPLDVAKKIIDELKPDEFKLHGGFEPFVGFEADWKSKKDHRLK